MLIGVFDSGIGGLTVLRALRAAWPGHSTIYLGDTARVPYGSKSPETVIRYARQIADYLMSQKIELLIVACNTVSANALGDLAHLPVPVIGVIHPGAQAAARAVAAHHGSEEHPHIGVIGTRATINSGAYQRALAQLLPEARISPIACPLLVPLADEGWEDSGVARTVVAEYLKDWLPADGKNGEKNSQAPSVLVLGCTHYPILRPAFEAVLGPGVELIDSAETTARALEPFLKGASSEARPSHRLIVTDGAPGFAGTAARMLGEPAVEFEVVDLSPHA